MGVARGGNLTSQGLLVIGRVQSEQPVDKGDADNGPFGQLVSCQEHQELVLGGCSDGICEGADLCGRGLLQLVRVSGGAAADYAIRSLIAAWYLLQWKLASLCCSVPRSSGGRASTLTAWNRQSAPSMESLEGKASTGVADSWCVTVSCSLPETSLQPTAVPGQDSARRMSIARCADHLPAKGCLGATVYMWRV